ncbi:MULTISPECIES: hypothetical protein [unclassified Streptomyces]|uniref:hypothetical protein n=1 Tax=unclassified Streptomyces TaxID=2593676 RepID=UPI000B86791A|nr:MULTISPECIES: hypothetical protein [unclassified Streptomyces]MYZ36125.1 hypothetical protein [Streptomyces sp. SID4917]
MSSHYEVVLSCLLRDDTPDSVLAALRWHLGMDTEEPEDLDFEECPSPLLEPNPNSRLPGGDFVSLRRQVQGFSDAGEVHAWELFARTYWVDDHMLYLTTLLDLIAPYVAVSGYGGHHRDEYGTATTAFVFHGGTYDPVGF